MLFDPARSADPPITFGIFETISKNFSEHFLVAIGSNDFRYSIEHFLLLHFYFLQLLGIFLLNLFDKDHLATHFR